MAGKTVLIIGYGVLGGKVLDEIVRAHPDARIVVAGRDESTLLKRINLARYAALNYGEAASVEPVTIDLFDVSRTSSVIREVGPDIVFNATSMVPWWKLDLLPADRSSELKSAGSGIWAATDLLLPIKLTAALEESGFRGAFVNGSFPDLVNPVIFRPEIGPICGVGNVANAVPGLTLAAAYMLNVDVRDVRIRFVGHHFLSYNMPATGTNAGAPFGLQVLVRDTDCTPSVDPDTLFRTVAGRFGRVKGVAGQAVTVSSAMSVLSALIGESSRYAHAPGVLGRPGGYPIRIERGQVEFDLPPYIDLDAATEINVSGGRWDGIEAITDAGEIIVTARAAEIANSMLAYDANAITAENCESKAFELKDKFERLLNS